MGELIGNADQVYEPVEWNKLKEEIKSKYTIDPDHKMFVAILNGASVVEASKLADALKRNWERTY